VSATRSLPHGIVASSVTPFTADGALDLGRLGPHIDWLIADGVAGLSPLGSSGEFFALESADRMRVAEAALDANAGRVHTMVGTHHYSTRIAIELSRHAERAGADSLLVVPPYYGLPTPEGVLDHYRRIADAVSIPVVLYHNAAGTNVDVATEQLFTLFAEGAIRGVKMSHLLPDRMVELLQADLPDGATIYAGIDYVAFEGLAHGAHGWISAIPSMTPRVAAELYETLAVRGDLPAARAQWRRLAPLMRFVFGASHISRGRGAHWAAIMKAGLSLIGPDVGLPLTPSSPLTPDAVATLAGLLRGLGYEVDPAAEARLAVVRPDRKVPAG
jgi:4-hydroxy-tetrahydrodipicolinate synthase